MIAPVGVGLIIDVRRYPQSRRHPHLIDSRSRHAHDPHSAARRDENGGPVYDVMTQGTLTE
ncbi:hypothetical protein BH18ACT15_BH18ACT15_09970 [soil metagenome]